jgi:hypothetical protein
MTRKEMALRHFLGSAEGSDYLEGVADCDISGTFDRSKERNSSYAAGFADQYASEQYPSPTLTEEQRNG